MATAARNDEELAPGEGAAPDDPLGGAGELEPTQEHQEELMALGEALAEAEAHREDVEAFGVPLLDNMTLADMAHLAGAPIG